MNFMRPGNPNRRLRLFGSLIVLAAIAFAFKLVQLQVIDAPKINAVSIDNRSVHRVISAVRGSITDSAGNVLARSVFRYDINAAPSKVGPINRKISGQTVSVPVEQVAAEIAAILEMTPEEVVQKINMKSRNYFVYRLKYNGKPNSILVFESMIPNKLNAENIKTKITEIDIQLKDFVNKRISRDQFNTNASASESGF